MQNIDSEDTIKSFVKACREVDRRGLVRCSSGNMSWRLDAERMLVSRSRCWLGDMTEADVAICRIDGGTSLNGIKPTVEVLFHSGIMKRRTDISVVLHYQAPYSTTLACRDQAGINYDVIPEVPFYIGPIGHVQFKMPGSAALAEVVVKQMANRNLAQMSNHGQVVVAADFEHALQNAVFFELACQIIVLSRGAERPIPPGLTAQLTKSYKG